METEQMANYSRSARREKSEPTNNELQRRIVMLGESIDEFEAKIRKLEERISALETAVIRLTFSN